MRPLVNPTRTKSCFSIGNQSAQRSRVTIHASNNQAAKFDKVLNNSPLSRTFVSFANSKVGSLRLKPALYRPVSCLQAHRKNQTYVVLYVSIETAYTTKDVADVTSTPLPKTPGSTTIMAVSDAVVSKKFPIIFSASDFPGLAKGDEKCDKCNSSKMLYVVVTNFNSKDATVWMDHPVVFDAFSCPVCSNTRLRGISTTEYEQTMSMGIQFAKQKKYEEAEYCLRKAANSWCHFTAAQINLGNMFFQQFVEELSKRVPDQLVLDRAAKFCKEHYLQAFKLSNRIPAFVYRHLGIIYKEHDNNYNESNDYLHKFLEHPDVEPHQIDTIKAIVDDNEVSIGLPSSLKVMEEYLVFNPEEGASLVAPKPIETDEDIKTIETAANTISDLLKRTKKSNHKYHFMVAKAYQAINNEQKANEHFQILYQDNPKNADYAREFSVSCLNLGQLEDSLKSAKVAVEIRPNDFELQSNLALVLLFANETDKALLWVNKALASRPEDEITKNVYNLIMNVKTKNVPIEQVMKDYMANSTENK